MQLGHQSQNGLQGKWRQANLRVVHFIVGKVIELNFKPFAQSTRELGLTQVFTHEVH